jgi:DnaK suppressor protein
MARYGVRRSDGLTRRQLAELKRSLEGERAVLLETASESRFAEREREKLTSVDEMDESADEVMRAAEHRLRDRERGKLHKIERALQRIAAGTYNECESCGEPIGYDRLRARSVTTLCIACKEKQEAAEKQTYEPPRWNTVP